VEIGIKTETTTTNRSTISRTSSYIVGLMSKRLLVSIIASSVVLVVVVNASLRSDEREKLKHFRKLEQAGIARLNSYGQGV
jgi:ribosomal protein L30E